jgi:N-acetylglutamate synthase-like GNAT family acetyltransferase
VSTHDAEGALQATTIRIVEPKDDLILRVILRDGIRFCGALGAGSGLNIDERDPLSLLYEAPRAGYFVADRRDTVIGGAGIAPLPCDFAHIAELQRFVLLPMRSHLETGRRLLDQCLDAADRAGFSLCYVELNSAQTAMIELLDRAGFKATNKPLRAPTDPTSNAYYCINLASP